MPPQEGKFWPNLKNREEFYGELHEKGKGKKREKKEKEEKKEKRGKKKGKKEKRGIKELEREKGPREGKWN